MTHEDYLKGLEQILAQYMDGLTTEKEAASQAVLLTNEYLKTMVS